MKAADSSKSCLEVAALLGSILASALTLLVTFAAPGPREPWRILLGVAPLAVLAAWLATQALMGQRLALRGRAGLALAAYATVFSILAASDLFSWRRSLIGYEAAVPVNRLGLGRAGDWHYWLANRQERRADFLVVTQRPPTGLTLEEVRLRLASLIALARQHGARGVAFDFYFDLESALDSRFCQEIEMAWSRKPAMPVFAGFAHRVEDGLPVRVPSPASLTCLDEGRVGHLALYRESDGKIRMAPLYLGGNDSLKSLDCKIAEELGPRRPCDAPDALVQFIEPQHEGVFNRGIEAIQRNAELVRGRFLLVGRASLRDSFDTPFGTRLGVMIHGSVVQALRDGAMVRRLSWWWSAPTIGACCYVIASLFVRRTARRTVLIAATAMSLAIVTAAAMAMRISLVWVDISYPLIAIWLLVLLLFASEARIQAHGAIAKAAPKREA